MNRTTCDSMDAVKVSVSTALTLLFSRSRNAEGEMLPSLEVVKGAEKYVVLLFSHPWQSDKYTERFQRQNLSSIQDKRLQVDCWGNLLM